MLDSFSKIAAVFQKKHLTNRIIIISASIVLLLVLGAGWIITSYLGRYAEQEVINDSNAASATLSILISSELEKIESAVKSLADSPEVYSSLQFGKPQDIQKINSALDRYNLALGGDSVTYLMDETGKTLASSNRYEQDSFVGQRYNFRPYFQEARQGKASHYFALGVTSGKRGFYASHPVYDRRGKIIGVAVMKKDLDAIEDFLKKYALCFFIDQDGVIFLASRPALLFKTLWPMAEEKKKELIKSRQFGNTPLDSLMPVHLTDGGKISWDGNKYYVSRKSVEIGGWSIVLLTSTKRINVYQLIGIISTLCVFILVTIFFTGLYLINAARKRIEKSEDRFRRLANATFEGILIHDNGIIVDYNQAMLEMFGYEPDEAIGKNVLEFVWPEYHAVVIEHIKMKDGSPYEIMATRKNGEPLPIELAGKPYSYNGKPMRVVALRDISERKKAEAQRKAALEEQEKAQRALQIHEEKLHLIAENTRDVIWMLNIEDIRFTFMTPSIEKLSGYTLSEYLNKSHEDIILPDSYELLMKTLAEEVALEKLPGSDPLRSRTVETRQRHKNGNIIWVEITATAMRDAEGRAIGILGFSRDITERKRSLEEKERLQKELQNVQKMESIGTLAGGIAHDFNNLLMGIQGYTSLMLMDYNSGHPHYQSLKNIESQIKSGAELTSQLLGLARGGKYEAIPTDLNELLTGHADIFGRTKKEIIIEKKLQNDLWTVEVDRSQIGRVLLNMFVNAWQAMPAGGVLYLSTQNVTLADADVRPYQIKAGNYVRLTVEDTGVGMDEKTRERVFDPFFTTRSMGRGTGLGLPSAYGIIKNHGGIINVESKKGQGTTFNIFLPASLKTIEKSSVFTVPKITGSETILLVDDEQMVLEVVRIALEKIGYRVFTAAGGKDAVIVFRENKDKIDLVILDMIMPGIGGGETFEILKSIDPQVKVILSSGYSIEGRAKDIMQRGCKAFIQKPFQIEELSKKIQEVLSR